MAFLEVRAFPPVRAGDDVHFAVVIEIAEAGPFAPELVGKLNFFKAVNAVIGR